jgi:hypothetical protein
MTITVRNKRTFKGTGYYIGRPSPLGNPFPMYNESERSKVISKYRAWLYEQISNSESVRTELDYLCDLYRAGTDINLICYCAPKSCHGDVIKEWIEAHCAVGIDESDYLDSTFKNGDR